LRHKNLVVARKDGNQVFYSVRDPLLIRMLEIMRRYFRGHFEDAIKMYKQLEKA
jgi:hypothetical protein